MFTRMYFNLKKISLGLNMQYFAICITVLFFAKPLFSQKFGHVNTETIRNNMSEIKTAEAELQKYAKEWENILQEMSSEFQQKYGKYNELKNTSSSSTLLLESKEKELQDLQVRIQETQVKAQEKLKQKELELLQPILDKIKSIVSNFGKANGYTYIFDASSGVTLYNGGTDVTQDVLKKLSNTASP